MTRWFHAAAAVLFALAIWVGLSRAPARTPASPQAQLVTLMKQSGLDYDGARAVFVTDTLLRFRSKSCPTPYDVVYFPSLSRITSGETDAIERTGGQVTYVHDGETIGRLSPVDLAGRWFWRKLEVAARLRPTEAWQSIALALLAPRGCETPKIDWGSLRRTG